MQLSATLQAWGTPAFADTLKRELAMHATALPLQQALSVSSAVADEPIQVSLISAEGKAESIHVRVAIFFAGIIAGCNCSDDPTPVESQPEYCELTLLIDRSTGCASVTLVS